MNIVDKIFLDPITKRLRFFTRGGDKAPELGESITASFTGITVGTSEANATSILVPKGRWVFTAQIWSVSGIATHLNISVNDVSATEGTNGINRTFGASSGGAGGGYAAVVGYVQTLTADTTYYAVVSAGTSIGACYGNITALRCG